MPEPSPETIDAVEAAAARLEALLNEFDGNVMGNILPYLLNISARVALAVGDRVRAIGYREPEYAALLYEALRGTDAAVGNLITAMGAKADVVD
jgi:hypothetical protein